VEVHLYGRLRRQRPEASDGGLTVRVGAGATIGDVLGRLGLRPEEVSHLFLNFQYSRIGRRVRDGDRLGVFPREMSLLYRQYFPFVEE
jgi:hypothetical protein